MTQSLAEERKSRVSGGPLDSHEKTSGFRGKEFLEMGTKFIFALSLALLLLSAGLLRADCTDFSRATSWSVEGEQKIIFYRGSTPFASVVLEDCWCIRTPMSGSRSIICAVPTKFLSTARSAASFP
jgi:hypothetical protein